MTVRKAESQTQELHPLTEVKKQTRSFLSQITITTACYAAYLFGSEAGRGYAYVHGPNFLWDQIIKFYGCQTLKGFTWSHISAHILCQAQGYTLAGSLTPYIVAGGGAVGGLVSYWTSYLIITGAKKTIECIGSILSPKKDDHTKIAWEEAEEIDDTPTIEVNNPWEQYNESC